MCFAKILVMMESAIPNLALSLADEARFSRLTELVLVELLESLDVGISGIVSKSPQ